MKFKKNIFVKKETIDQAKKLGAKIINIYFCDGENYGEHKFYEAARKKNSSHIQWGIKAEADNHNLIYKINS